VAGSACSATGTPQSSNEWTKVWLATFAGRANAGVDTKAWEYKTGRGIFGDGEIETMTSSAQNVHLDGRGNLDITAVGQGSSWTSGRIQTKTSEFVPPPGKEMMVTASIKQPDPGNALGYWPAFWLVNPDTSWPQHGEIDILEDVNGLSMHSGTFHCGNTTHRNADGSFGPCHEDSGLGRGLLPCPKCQEGYHTYTVIIDRRTESNQQIRWYLDGRLYFAVAERQVGRQAWVEAVDHSFSIIVELQMGGSYPNEECQCKTPTSKTTSGGTMSVRYVGVYDRP
jgi:hypothetical protein